MIPIPPSWIAGAVGFLGRWWKVIAVVAVVMAYTVAVYWAGGRAPRAELKQHLAEDAAARAQAEADDEVDSNAAAALAQQIDEEHDERHDRLNRTWASELERLRNERNARPPGQPVRQRPEVCTDAAGNDRLSNALARYGEGVRGVIRAERAAAADYRERAGRLLAICHAQAGDLAEVVDWYGRASAIWRARGDAPTEGRVTIPPFTDPAHWWQRPWWSDPSRLVPGEGHQIRPQGDVPEDQEAGRLENDLEPGGGTVLK